MQTGWVSSGGKWYYLDSKGAMQTGWITINGIWYLLGRARSNAPKAGRHTTAIFISLAGAAPCRPAGLLPMAGGIT